MTEQEWIERAARILCEAKGLSPDALYQHNFEGDWPEDKREEYADGITGEPRVMLFHKAWRRHEAVARSLYPLVQEAVGGWQDMVLPCDVRLPPATTITAGCTMATLMTALSLEGRPKNFRPLSPAPKENDDAKTQ